MSEYLEKLNHQNLPAFTKTLEEYANNYHVPIVKEDSLMVILTIIKCCKVKRVLEIGTAIGYSAMQMASCIDDIYVDTIEKDEKMYQLAISDLIFIDAAKAQSKKFFERFNGLLNEQGIIITDNILFHGCVEKPENLTKNVRKMVEKIAAYNTYLTTLTHFETTFLAVGDGLAITMRK